MWCKTRGEKHVVKICDAQMWSKKLMQKHDSKRWCGNMIYDCGAKGDVKTWFINRMQKGDAKTWLQNEMQNHVKYNVKNEVKKQVKNQVKNHVKNHGKNHGKSAKWKTKC